MSDPAYAAPAAIDPVCWYCVLGVLLSWPAMAFVWAVYKTIRMRIELRQFVCGEGMRSNA